MNFNKLIFLLFAFLFLFSTCNKEEPSFKCECDRLSKADFPSAKEMEEGTLDIGDFQFKQLEKIEKLTLYIIEINNRLEKVEIENEKLKEENQN